MGQADLILKNAIVLTMNAEKEIFDRGTVVIKGKKIAAVGDKTLTEKFDAQNVLDVNGDIIMPGMINAHTHVSMIVFRSLADDVPDRLHRFIFPLEKKMMSPKMVSIGAKLGNIEMVKGGVTTYADMYYFEDQVAETVENIGMRAVLGQTIINFPVADARDPEEGIAYAERFINRYHDHELITPAFAPHAPYSTTPEILQKVHQLSQEYQAPVLMHVAETEREFQQYQKEYQLTPIGYLRSIRVLDHYFVAAHAIFATSDDIQILKDHHVGISHNMSANIKSANGVAPALKMFNRGLRIGLGTDGPMSGNSISIIDELHQVAKIHKLVNKDRSVMPPIDVVEMTTIGGARALHMEDRIGSLEVEKLADIVVVSTHDVNITPIYNPYSALVYSANAANVRHVIINGRMVMKDRKVLTVDEEEARQGVIQFTQKVRNVLIESGEKVM
jgi:5-methylthioadenosine/S-adenosylhomocysteine deaminase